MKEIYLAVKEERDEMINGEILERWREYFEQQLNFDDEREVMKSFITLGGIRSGKIKQEKEVGVDE